MSLKPAFFQYLDHFRATQTLASMHENPADADVIGLRHDIDHDLDLALEVAHHEHQRGLRATYCLLHTHPYWDDPDFLIKCRQLEAYGHEVSLHLNVVTEWFAGRCDDLAGRLRDVLEPLRAGGVRITGVSGHGDRACYQRGFVNGWIWRELRGARFGEHVAVDQPMDRGESCEQVHHLVSAEGVQVDDPDWQIAYPSDHQLRRDDGATLPLWSVSLRDLGLAYDACYVGLDRYWTDSGGKWTRSDDPLQADLSRGRHQVLMHPVWWRGPQRKVFVVSTARSGSKWLANFVDKATSCRGLHEVSLNIERRGDDFVDDKRTDDAYLDLLDDPALKRRRLRDALTYLSQHSGDVLEANVYLEPLLPELQAIEPEARIIHLHRNGHDVVRSILSRGWYDTPEDRRHRVPPIAQWSRANQFERACWYYRYTNESIMPAASARLMFERMVCDRTYLEVQLAAMDIVVHTLLAEREFGKVINANREQTFPAAEQWSAEQQATFDRICGPIQQVLGYADASEQVDSSWSDAADAQPAHEPTMSDLLEVDLRVESRLRVTPVKAVTSFSSEGLHIRTLSTKSNSSYLLVGGGRWASVSVEDGFPCVSGNYYKGSIEYEMDGEQPVRVFILFFDENARQIRKHQVGRLRPDSKSISFAFSPALHSSHFALALHLGDRDPEQRLVVRSIHLQSASIHPDYSSFSSAAT